MATTATSEMTPSRSLWNRELHHYPSTGIRAANLGIVVLVTIVLYYQLYLAGAVATKILADYHMSFLYFVNMNVAGYVLGAVASFCAGIADRYGRANIVTVGVLLTGLLCLVGVPNVHSGLGFAIVFVAIGFVEGIILVATPALIRDFSPQLGRASAMGFWTLGPVLGSLVVSICVSSTSDSTPWQDQYIACGIVGLAVAVLALIGLRELKPALRDQLMVSNRDRALLEARAKGIDVEATLRHPLRQMLKLDILGSAFAISVFLIIYYLAVGFFPVYFQTIFGFSQSKANSLGNWFWAFDALALLVTGLVSDLVRVRKPFMLAGAVGAVVFTILFAARATRPDTSYGTFVVLLIFLSSFLGVAYAPWMASFTETIERRNPALTATGLALWGLIIRTVIAISVFFVPHIVDTVTTLVEKGPVVQAAAQGHDPALNASQNAVVKAVVADPSIGTKVQTLALKYKAELVTAQKLSPATQAALAANPTAQSTQVTALSELSGADTATVKRVLAVAARYPDELATASAIDQATQARLLANPADTSAQANAAADIEAKFHVSAAAAGARLTALANVPSADLAFMAAHAAPVQQAGAELAALGKVPPADLAFVGKYGPTLEQPKVQASLKYLQANAPSVLKAAEDSPGQWKDYFWIAVGGEILFIPLIFVMAGFWDPRKAKRREQEHEAWVETELAKLAATGLAG